MTTTVLSPESVIEIVKSIGPDDPLSIARDIEQAVLQSPEVQRLRKLAITPTQSSIIDEVHRRADKEWAVDGHDFTVTVTADEYRKLCEEEAAIDAAMEKQP